MHRLVTNGILKRISLHLTFNTYRESRFLKYKNVLLIITNLKLRVSKSQHGNWVLWNWVTEYILGESDINTFITSNPALAPTMRVNFFYLLLGILMIRHFIRFQTSESCHHYLGILILTLLPRGKAIINKHIPRTVFNYP